MCIVMQKMILLGNLQIDKLLIVMKDQMPVVSEKTKEIFEKEFVGDNND